MTDTALPPKRLNQLFQFHSRLHSFQANSRNPDLNTGWEEIEIHGVTSDSRQVQPGFAFVAYGGETQDGHQFIEMAEKKGAAILFGEKEAPKGLKVPYVRVEDGRAVLAQMASAYYDFPSLAMQVIGVTGTSGKTTTTYLIESILKAAGFQVGVIGTVNSRFGTQVFSSSHTTPGPVELQSLLHEMKKAGCTAVVMEVSSHALKQKRVAGVAFDGMVFTNLSPEHLDYHSDMEDYFRSKSLLFTEYANQSRAMGKSPVGAVNTSDPFGKRLVEMIRNLSREASSSALQDIQMIKIGEFHGSEGLKIELEGITGKVGSISIQSSLTGQFNGENIAGAVRIAELLGVGSLEIQKGISELKGVPGRLERVGNSRGVHVWVDYAHKPDALEKVLKTLRQIKGKNQLITVFGCGGDRDRKKRPVMGRIAVEYSDSVWITSDNPRTEDPFVIIQEIVSGVADYRNYSIEADRKKAIEQAVRMAKSGDLILVAGKGHEDYQILGTQKVHFDDRQVVSEAFSKVSHVE